jgi:hypothetical protein
LFYIEERSFVAALLWMTANGRFVAVCLASLRAERWGDGVGVGKAVAEPPHSKGSARRVGDGLRFGVRTNL